MPEYIPEEKIIINIETDATKTLSHVLIPAPSKFFIAILNNMIIDILVF
tara:strand:- start:249 stop:395 length:147 start_codon:yes stop_codon:yes gene_type:complete